MTWQDELQKLDNELASGRISADDYRRRRDEILSGSAGGAPAQAAQQAPFAPPFKWEAKPPSASNSDATQVVPNQVPQQQPQQQNPNPDATQVVNTQNRSADAERTQYVTPVQPGPGGWGQPQQQQQPAPPPWIGGDFDSINQPSPGWSHGPEVFDEGSKGGKGKIIGIVLAVVLLAGLGFGAYWLWGRGGTDNNAGGDPSSTTSTSTTPSAPPDPLPAGKLPGKVAENKQVKDFTPVPTLKYLLDSEVLSYNVSGASKTKLVQFTTDDGAKGILLIVQAKDAAAAKTAARELADIQINNGMVEASGQPTGVLVGNLDAKGQEEARVRGHYTSKDLIIRLDMTAKTLDSAQKNFKDALDAQLKALSADE
ncbi:SHOCT domain-containing protein [Lentzea sp. NPDC058450]|uniref:SHOCT domain-containing protein n=1 Tax=Lentzea sp. NPDC058450 TaxID=3346505 RepID=UPI0036684249